jgi:2-dehydropantoate 2-reductase
LKILIIGTGGIGGYYGYKLQHSGNQVVFTARGRHLEALKNNGLTLVHENTTFQTNVNVHSHEEIINKFRPDDFDFIILTLKSHSTFHFVNEMGRWLKNHPTFILSLQNGVDNENILSRLLGEQWVIGGLAVRIGSHVVKPGVIKSTGKAEIIFGVWPNNYHYSDVLSSVINQISGTLNLAYIPNEVSSDIQKELWRKLMINNGVNPLSAITGLDTFTLTNQEKFGDIVFAMMQETLSAASADGVNLTQQDLTEMFELIKTFSPIKTSMLMDKEHGRTMELDSILGAVLNRCEKMGIDAPYNKMAYALLSNPNSG